MMKMFVTAQKKIVVFPQGDERLLGFALVLKNPSHIVTVSETIEDFLKGTARNFPDLIIYDPFVPGSNPHGLELISRVRFNSPKTKVLVISGAYDEEMIIRAFKEGASGYLLFNIHLHDFLKSVMDLFDGGAPMSREVAACLVSSYRVSRESPLTKREQDVLRELSTGKTYPYIADALHLSVHTVRTHIQNIFDKLNVRNKSEALVLARMQKLI